MMLIRDIEIQVRWQSPRRYKSSRFALDAGERWWLAGYCGVRRQPRPNLPLADMPKMSPYWINPAAWVQIFGLMVGAGILLENNS